MKFSKSKVEYASHNLSLYYGECPHNCKYCYVSIRFRKRKIPWSVGELRANPKAFELASKASKEGVEKLVVSFTSDPLPYSVDTEVMNRRVRNLAALLDILEKREIPTKVLTKNSQILLLAGVSKPYKHIQIGLSITTDSQNIYEFDKWEKGVTSIQSRLVALNYLKLHKFRVWVSCEPILPKTSLQTYLPEIQRAYPEEIWIGKGNYLSQLTGAFDWEKLVKHIQARKYKNVHFKQGLLKAAQITLPE